MSGRLGVGFIGSGFMTRFHIRSWLAVRDGDVRGVWSPTMANAEEAAGLARELGVGEARAFPTLEAMLEDPSIDCVWICGPNFARVDNMFDRRYIGSVIVNEANGRYYEPGADRTVTVGVRVGWGKRGQSHFSERPAEISAVEK